MTQRIRARVQESASRAFAMNHPMASRDNILSYHKLERRGPAVHKVGVLYQEALVDRDSLT